VDPKRSARAGMGAPSPPASGAGHAAQAKGGGPATPSTSESIDRLAADILQLRLDFERFFSGALLAPPEDLRRRVQAQLRQLRGVKSMTAVERFRLGDLEAQQLRRAVQPPAARPRGRTPAHRPRAAAAAGGRAAL